MSDTSPSVIPFGEWLPDQPDLGSGGLIEANNVIADVGFYKPFNPLAELVSTHYDLVGTARGLFFAADTTGTAVGKFYAATGTVL
ncbi:MAG TPA: hypothetical protein VFQ06_13920, partial [Nitrospira sp.]|nr:hypothetical protein [Nitrospira sp.]